MFRIAECFSDYTAVDELNLISWQVISGSFIQFILLFCLFSPIFSVYWFVTILGSSGFIAIEQIRSGCLHSPLWFVFENVFQNNESFAPLFFRLLARRFNIERRR